MLYYEDIPVGFTRDFGPYPVTREEVVEFASRYDPQPFHLSDEAAAETHFGRLAASGWHTCAMAMAMYVRHLREHPQASLGAAGIDELRWLKPVYPGDVLRGQTEVLDKRVSASKPDMGIFRHQMRVFNQDDEQVMSLIAAGLIRLRPSD